MKCSFWINNCLSWVIPSCPSVQNKIKFVLFLNPMYQIMIISIGQPSNNRLMGMCRWMESHFHNWIGYNGVTFSIDLLEWGHIFSGFWGENILASREFGD